MALGGQPNNESRCRSVWMGVFCPVFMYPVRDVPSERRVTVTSIAQDFKGSESAHKPPADSTSRDCEPQMYSTVSGRQCKLPH